MTYNIVRYALIGLLIEGALCAAEVLMPTVVRGKIGGTEYAAALTPEGWVGGRRWHAMRDFSEGLSLVQERKDGKWGAIDVTGRLVIPFDWDEVASAREGLIRVKKGNGWGYLNLDGTIALSPREEWAFAEAFSGGLAPVQMKGGKWGFIDRTGTTVIPAVLDDAFPFDKESSLALIQRNGLWGWIGRNGVERIPPA